MTDTADKFIFEAGYDKIVECNERIMLHVMLDYHADILRLKDFHNIENERTEKTFAYLAAWIVRRKPLQFIKFTEDEKDIFVNERFAAYLVINECLLCGKKKFVSRESKDKLDEYIDLVLYYFKYRECNPQVIELMIESFKTGTLVQ
ncbi:MAG: hypothetical protein LUH43_03045 [Clostridia bacterium]|nr:hypothetical protein [Clostridia bacterium]